MGAKWSRGTFLAAVQKGTRTHQTLAPRNLHQIALTQQFLVQAITTKHPVPDMVPPLLAKEEGLPWKKRTRPENNPYRSSLPHFRCEQA
jgi:hypothetical protein